MTGRRQDSLLPIGGTKGNGSEGIGLLTPNPNPDIKAPVKVHGGLKEMGGVGDEGSRVAIFLKDFCKGHLVFGDTLPPINSDSVTFLGDPITEGESPFARVNGTACRDRR